MENRLGIILIATRKYDVFVQPLIDSLDQFLKVPFKIFLFTDNRDLDIESDRAYIQTYFIDSFGFPLASLMRYQIISDHRDVLDTSHLLYLDVDMLLVDDVGDEVFVDSLLAVQHPGFYKGGFSGLKTPDISTAYIAPKDRGVYYCGGVQGGENHAYLDACIMLRDNIQKDFLKAEEVEWTDNHGVMSEWHDEGFWNWYLTYHGVYTPLSPAYCYPQSWDIPFEKKIIALDKNHKEIRS